MTQEKEPQNVTDLLKSYKYQVIGALIIVVLLISALFIWQHAMRVFSLRTLPILTEDTSTLVVIKPTVEVKKSIKIISETIADFLQIDEVESSLVLSSLSLSGANEMGIINRDGNLYWFAQLMVGDFINIDESSFDEFDLKKSSQIFNEKQYVFFGQKEWSEQNENYPSLYLEEKRVFSNLLSQVDIGILLPKGADAGILDKGTFYGSIVLEDGDLRLELAKRPEQINTELLSVEIPSSNFYISAEFWDENFPLQSIFNIDSDLLDRSKLFTDFLPGDISISKGSLDQFVVDPFQSDLHWLLKSSMSPEKAVEVLSFILTQLSEEFPQVEERLLPDNSVIYELKKNTDPFILEQPKVENLEKGIITYPLGQIYYEYDENTLFLERGENSSNTVDNYCIVSDSLIEGRMIRVDSGSGLWRTLDFSYGKGKIAVCIQGD